jgi:hypothetical protein
MDQKPVTTEKNCPHCGMVHSGHCPRVAAIEYHADGTVKRVEYRPEPSDWKSSLENAIRKNWT